MSPERLTELLANLTTLNVRQEDRLSEETISMLKASPNFADTNYTENIDPVCSNHCAIVHFDL